MLKKIDKKKKKKKKILILPPALGYELELSLSRKCFHGSKGVRATEVFYCMLIKVSNLLIDTVVVRI